MKKKYHYEGKDPDTGHAVFSECGTGKSLGLMATKEGKPVHPGESLVQVRPHADQEHYEIDTVLAHEADGTVTSGPAKVTSDEYRKGWDATFSNKEDRPN